MMATQLNKNVADLNILLGRSPNLLHWILLAGGYKGDPSKDLDLDGVNQWSSIRQVTHTDQSKPFKMTE
jgi:hypothetical protein